MELAHVFQLGVHYTPGDFPIDLVANIASRLLQGDNYEGAIERARELLRRCVEKGERDKTNARANQALSREARNPNSTVFPIPPGIATSRINIAIKRITGQTKRYLAESHFLSFLEAWDPDATKEERNECVARLEREGFDSAHVWKLTEDFTRLHREGKFTKEWPSQKKSLTQTRKGKLPNVRVELPNGLIP